MNIISTLFSNGLFALSLCLAVTQTEGCTRESVSKPEVQEISKGNLSSDTTCQFHETDELPEVTYLKADKNKIQTLLNEARRVATSNKEPKSWMLWFGKKFLGVPYVGGTLDAAKQEKLVVNTSQLDCTTFVEIVTALTMCAEKKEESFEAFCQHLLHVRYINGQMAYEKRQHYFTAWIDDNVKEGIIEDIQVNPPFTAVQKISVNWMTTHSRDYKMLRGNAERLRGIKDLENSINGKTCRYIPKGDIANDSLFRETIHDGDIIAIVTNKKGLDTTHIGIASWHEDGLHLLNASSIHKQVVDEPMTLKTYMSKHPVQVGIRVCRVK